MPPGSRENGFVWKRNGGAALERTEQADGGRGHGSLRAHVGACLRPAVVSAGILLVLVSGADRNGRSGGT